MIALARGSAAPAARHGGLAFLFLGLFLLYPLFEVFSASMLDAEGEAFTSANYTQGAGPALLPPPA